MPDLRALMILLVLLLTGTSAVLANPYVLLQRGGELLQQGQTEEALVVLHEAEKSLPDPTRAARVLLDERLALSTAHGHVHPPWTDARESDTGRADAVSVRFPADRRPDIETMAAPTSS